MKRIIVVICAVLLSFSAFAEKIKVTGKNTTTGNTAEGNRNSKIAAISIIGCFRIITSFNHTNCLFSF